MAPTTQGAKTERACTHWWWSISALCGLAGLAVWWRWPYGPLLLCLGVDWVVTVVLCFRAGLRGSSIPSVALVWLVSGALSGFVVTVFVLGWIIP